MERRGVEARHPKTGMGKNVERKSGAEGRSEGCKVEAAIWDDPNRGTKAMPSKGCCRHRGEKKKEKKESKPGGGRGVGWFRTEERAAVFEQKVRGGLERGWFWEKGSGLWMGSSGSKGFSAKERDFGKASGVGEHRE